MKILTGSVPVMVWANKGAVSDKETAKAARRRVGFSDMYFMVTGFSAECWGQKSLSLMDACANLSRENGIGMVRDFRL
jgi:hypothetical protein